jgi:chlorite dismutase
MQRPQIEKPDLREKGGVKDGQPQTMDRRLFMQLLAFGECDDSRPLGEAMRQAGVEGVVYEDLHDPRGVAVLAMHEDPAYFLGDWRALMNREPFIDLEPKPHLTMFGRTYAIGYEPDLEETLFGRPRHTALNPAWPWAVWYPLRRTGGFMQLDGKEQRDILMEHGVIGRAFGEADLAHDIRLVCYGLDEADNDFVIALIGKDLHPLSAVVESMRKTKQTSQYIEKLGPFWVGKAVWQAAE